MTDIQLPPLPEPDGYIPRTLESGEIVEIGAMSQSHAIEYARSAVELDRQQRLEPVGSFVWDGDEWRMVAAEYQGDGDVVLYRNVPQPAEPVVKQSLTTADPTACCADPRPDCMGMLVEGIGNRCAALAQQSLQVEPMPLSRTEDWIEPVAFPSEAEIIKAAFGNKSVSAPANTPRFVDSLKPQVDDPVKGEPSHE